MALEGKRRGIKRRQAAEQFLKSFSGKLEGFYFAFGDTDVFVIVAFPDNMSAAGAYRCSCKDYVTTAGREKRRQECFFA